jgi:putative transposase
LQAAAKRTPSTSTKPVIDDSALLDRIRQVVAERPSYGYRFVTAMLNGTVGAVRVNHKRVYRVMREHGLLLASRLR